MASEAQDGEPTVDGSTANAPDGAGSGDANEPGTDAGMASGGPDAAAQRPSWEGLVTLDASITIGPDGAVISGGVPHDDPAKAGPVLNAKAQAACLMLAGSICNRSADCQSSLAQVPAARRSQRVASCQDTFLLNHNCNRAVSTSAEFAMCAESVKSRDCLTVFANEFATSCVNQITFQP